MGNCPGPTRNWNFLKQRYKENTILGTPGTLTEIQEVVNVESAWGRGLVFLFKKKEGPCRALNEKKRAPQVPGLHVYISMYEYMYAKM